MKKRILRLILVFILLFILSMSVVASKNDVTIMIDSQEVEFNAASGEPFIDANGRTQVPLRVVMEQYGCRVEWDGSNNTAVITKSQTKVVVPIGQSYIMVNGETVIIDTAAVIRNGRTYLPIRAVLEAFGADVNWDNGTVYVTSSTSGEFENIYIDKDGSLIFELANGNKINAGSVSDGKDGKNGKDGQNGVDGVSVTNAYVDDAGNLMIELSSGRTINAGNIGVGGSMSELTFADYPVGTKFFLTQPTGAFDVTVYIDDTPYVVEFDSVYYELTNKYDFGDANAMEYNNGWTRFFPYHVVLHASGRTETSLQGSKLTLSLSGEYTGLGNYATTINKDGSFNIEGSIGGKKPQALYFYMLDIEKPTIEEEIENYPQFNGTLRTSNAGVEMIKDLEGFIQRPTWDVGQYSVGYGCSSTYAEKYGFDPNSMTKDQAHQLLLFVLNEMEDSLDKFLDLNGIVVDQYQYDALMSFTYNNGKGAINGTSRIGKLLLSRDYTVNEMASAFGIYCHTGTGKNAVVQDHLVSRRIREAKLFLYGAYNFNDVEKKFCRLTYSGNVPSVYPDVALYLQGSPYQILFDADPSSDYANDGMYFVGWYTEDGEKITAETLVRDNLTVYPMWSDTPEDPELFQNGTPHVHTGPALSPK